MNLVSPFLPFRKAALFLDFDGTLAPIASTPQGVRPNPRMNRLVHRLDRALGGRLAVISGRPVSQIDSLLDSAGLCVAGVHGLERRARGGKISAPAPAGALQDAEAVMRAFAAAQPGLMVEPKGLSVALHYRLAPGAEEAVLEMAERVACATGLQLQNGKMVVELKSPGPDKGEALATYMTERPFRGSIPVFVGDDLTDEVAFDRVRRLGGMAVVVGGRSPTRAAWRLPTQAAVQGWLERAAQRRAFGGGELKAIL